MAPSSDPNSPPPPRPRDDEVEVFGLTHVGKVRTNNEDHFLLGSLHPRIHVLSTSLSDPDRLSLDGERLAFLAMIADGVGGGRKGEEASRLALEEITNYIADSTRVFYQGDSQGDDFTQILQDAAIRVHERIQALAAEDPERRGMATTLTLYFGVWPWIYLLQVGDSRYYMYHHGELTQVTRDQTMAQELVDQGVLKRTDAFSSRWANVLSSSIGGKQNAPVVTRLRQEWGNVHLMCSDGLTKHVPDARIAERLGAMTSARQACEDLLQDALDGGGTDNITIIVGRAAAKAPAAR
ncbi:MAG: protein phosphatase 2C domain-containing protein [Actinomycetota bacterium]|nr:protein phosphatase 2C domain-containing protein [Actinomycetota bacterium]